MSLDSRIEKNIDKEVKNENQRIELSNRIKAWFESVADGNEKIEDDQSVFDRMERVLDVVGNDSEQ